MYFDCYSPIPRDRKRKLTILKWIDVGFISCIVKEKACPSRSIKKGHAFSFIPAALTPRKIKTE